MSNAAKLKKKAAEFEQKKQFDKALQLYIQILDTGADDGDEGDVALYNRVGDLLMRQGTVGDAMTYYEKAVDLYAESGFFNNAIALCNKILRQSPGRNSIYYKLGKISAKKGFISDAKQNFLEYASRMQAGGQLDEAFRALKEFADLCPDQDDIRLMLADQLSKKDRKGEALEQLQVLYQKFEHEGRGADMRATVDRMRAIDPAAEPKAGGGPRNPKSTDLVFLDLSDGGAAGGVAAAAAPAAPLLAPPVAPVVPPPAAKPRPPAGPPPAAHRGAPPARGPGARPAARPPTADLPLIEVDLPPLDAAHQIEEPRAPAPRVAGLVPPEVSIPRDAVDTPLVTGLEASSHRAAPASEKVPELPGLQPLSGEQFASLRLATPFHVPVIEPPAHDLALPGELPPIGGALLSAVNFTGEMELIMPEGEEEVSPGRSGKALAGRGRGGSPASHTHRDDREPDIALPMLDVDLPELDQPLSRGSRHGSEPLGLAGGADLVDEIPVGDESLDQDENTAREESDSGDALSASDGMPDLDRPLSASGETEAFEADATMPEWAAAPDPIDSEVDEAIEFMAGDSAARREVWPELRAADDEDDADDPEDSDAGPEVDEAPVQRDDAESFAGANGTAPGAGDTADAAAPGGAPRRRSNSELARSVDALLVKVEANPQDWGLRRQLAEALLDDGDREAGLRELEASMIGLERAQDLEGARSMADVIIRLNPNSVRHHQKRVEYAFRTNDRPRLPEAYLELADALFRSGQADKARAVYQRVLELAPDDARAQAALSAFGDPPDVAAGDASPGATLPAGVPREPTPPAAPAVRPSVPNVRRRNSGPKSGIQSAAPREPGQFVNLGDWLRDDEAPKSTRMVIDDEKTGDPEADFADMLRQFKHGIAQNVADEDHESHYDLGVAYKEMGLLDEAISEFQKALRGPGHRVRTYEALGQCFIEKQQFQVAATILSRALDEPGVTDDQLVGVLYLLGYASEALMRWEAAIGYYQRVFAVDIQFRDAGQRLTRLERAPR
jgi:tetratricopeptide (TPR) repeat protein